MLKKTENLGEPQRGVGAFGSPRRQCGPWECPKREQEPQGAPEGPKANGNLGKAQMRAGILWREDPERASKGSGSLREPQNGAEPQGRSDETPRVTKDPAEAPGLRWGPVPSRSR